MAGRLGAECEHTKSDVKVAIVGLLGSWFLVYKVRKVLKVVKSEMLAFTLRTL